MNTCIRLGFFVIIVYLLSALKRALERERELSRIDAMTGAYNNRTSRFYYKWKLIALEDINAL